MKIHVANNGGSVTVQRVSLHVDGPNGLVYIESDPTGTTKHQEQIGSSLTVKIVPLEQAGLIIPDVQLTMLVIDFGFRLVQRVGLIYEPEIWAQYKDQFQLGEPTVQWEYGRDGLLFS